LRDSRPLGLKGILVELKKEVAKDLFNKTRIGGLEGVVPLPRLLAYAKMTIDGKVFGVYRAPEQIERRIIDVLSSSAKVKDILGVGYTLPVRFFPELDDKSIAELFEYGVSHPPQFRSRMPLLDMMIYSFLDYNPLAKVTEMLRLELLDKARLELGIRARLTRRYIFRHYRALSDKGLVGRVSLSGMFHINSLWGFVVVERACASDLYVWASRNLATTNIFVSDDYVAATIALPREGLAGLARIGSKCGLGVHVIARGIWTPFPWELYDPRREKWDIEPVSNLPEVLRKYRILEFV
ncbi:MAG: hypothetical protein ABWW69_05435, partial [Pyrodictiaceae archaeon]